MRAPRARRRPPLDVCSSGGSERFTGGKFVGPSAERVTLLDLLDALKIDYQNNGRRSLATLEWRLAPLKAAFPTDRAIDVTETRIETYKAARLAEGKKPATVNRESAALKRAFRLGVKQKRIQQAPAIEMLAEHNARQGFLEPADFDAIVGHLPAYLQDFARFAYLSGWRRGEIASLVWSDVDRAGGRIILRRENSKNEEPRILPLIGELTAIIERRWAARLIPGPHGPARVTDLVFHRRGRLIGDFRKAWQAACKAAGLAGILFHDLRRSAVRNLDQAGVGQKVAMQITGHKTDSVYRRYRIVPEDDMRDALARTQAALGHSARVVTSIREAQEARA